MQYRTVIKQRFSAWKWLRGRCLNARLNNHRYGIHGHKQASDRFIWHGKIGIELVNLTSADRLNIVDDVYSLSGIVSEMERLRPEIVFIYYIQKIKCDTKRSWLRFSRSLGSSMNLSKIYWWTRKSRRRCRDRVAFLLSQLKLYKTRYLKLILRYKSNNAMLILLYGVSKQQSRW